MYEYHLKNHYDMMLSSADALSALLRSLLPELPSLCRSHPAIVKAIGELGISMNICIGGTSHKYNAALSLFTAAFSDTYREQA